MTFGILLLLGICFLLALAMISRRQVSGYKARALDAQDAKRAADERFLMLREELSSLKGKHSHKAKQLEEMREISKKRLRKDSQKGKFDEVPTMNQVTANPDLDLAVKTVQEQAEDSYKEKLARVKEQYEGRIKKLESQIGQKKERLQKAKVKGEKNVMLDMESLSEEVVLELGRLLRRSENAEKMMASNRGKLQMSQERFSELQKRYFGVCRELALVNIPAADATLSDEEARNKAEDMLASSDAKSVDTKPVLEATKTTEKKEETQKEA